jgi:hypothetical protein
MIEVIRSTETSVLTRATRRQLPENGTLLILELFVNWNVHVIRGNNYRLCPKADVDVSSKDATKTFSEAQFWSLRAPYSSCRRQMVGGFLISLNIGKAALKPPC